MNRGWTSATGLALAGAYLLFAAVLFHEALTCTRALCDLAAIPAIVPFGFPVAWLTDWLDGIFLFPGYTPGGQLRYWTFILPTVALNALFYAWVGGQVARLWNWWQRRRADRE